MKTRPTLLALATLSLTPGAAHAEEAAKPHDHDSQENGPVAHASGPFYILAKEMIFDCNRPEIPEFYPPIR